MKQLDIDARLKFLEWVGGNPKSLEALAENIFELHEGAWAQSFIDCVYQYSWHHKPDLYDKYILFDTIQELNGVDGSYLVFQVRVGDLPYADKDVTGNNQVLSRLPPPFAAAFTGGNQGEDGYFSWVSPVHIPIKVKDIVFWLLLDKGTLPLEVGTNTSSKFAMYMKSRGGVARWPYGSNYITIFINRRLITAYAPSDEGFDELRINCKESIDDCLIDRNPWERWRAEVVAKEARTPY